MPLEPPQLDLRRYADLVAELRSRIPRYTPEWTDHNDSDPGMTLIQLFSWLGEMILYRLNRVPERNYIEFLRMIGIERQPAAPARADLTFVLAAPTSAPAWAPKGTQVSAQAQSAASAAPGAGPEEPVVFETDEPFFAMAAQLTRVQVFDGVAYHDLTVENEPGGRAFAAFGPRAREDSAFLLGFDSDNAFPTEQLSLALRLAPESETRSQVSCDFDESQIKPPATIAWEYWDGAIWRQLDVIQDQTRSLTRSGYLYFRGPQKIRKSKLGLFTSAQEKALFWIRCHLIRSSYERPPLLDTVLANTVRATAVTSVRGEVLGSSNGQPNQGFQLRQAPIWARPPTLFEERIYGAALDSQPPNEAQQLEINARLRERELAREFLLEVDEGNGLEPWEEVDDFYQSGETARHYTLNRATGAIVFGNGERGAIPLAGLNNIVCRLYRYGGGRRGNVGVGVIKGLLSPVPGVESVGNRFAAEGGSDEEPLKDAKARAPKELKTGGRAVTIQDFEFLARQTPGVRIRRAHALPLFHPQFPGVKVPGAITVIVVPESDSRKPLPSEGTMETVCAWLKQRRLLTTEVFVAAPRYTHVRVEATVLAKGTADLAQLKSRIEQTLLEYLHPITGGADEQGWDLGQTIYNSEIYRVILTADGVDRLADVRLVIDGNRLARCADASIPAHHLVYSDSHDVTVIFPPEQA